MGRANHKVKLTLETEDDVVSIYLDGATARKVGDMLYRYGCEVLPL